MIRSVWDDDWMTRKETLMDEPKLCSQCGEPFAARACGPTHAIVGAPRASQAATATDTPGDDAGAAHDPHGGSAGHTSLRSQLRVLLEHMHLHEYDPDDYDAQADAIKVMVDAHVEQAIRAEGESLAAMLHERAQQSRTLTHRAVFGIASRLVTPDITPEDIERAILDGNFVVCDIPDDPAEGSSCATE